MGVGCVATAVAIGIQHLLLLDLAQSQELVCFDIRLPVHLLLRGLHRELIILVEGRLITQWQKFIHDIECSLCVRVHDKRGGV